jgi:hypothetical protein
MTPPATAITPGRPLLACPEWPTMYWLPSAIVERLDGLVAELAEAGFPSSRAEVIAALTLRCDPEEHDLEDRLTRYRIKFSPTVPRRPRTPETRALMVKLPSPISLRMDGLVELARRRGERLYRHELLGALILDFEDGPAALRSLCEELRQADARRAGLPGMPLRRFLSLARPSPGSRPPLPRIPRSA